MGGDRTACDLVVIDDHSLALLLLLGGSTGECSAVHLDLTNIWTHDMIVKMEMCIVLKSWKYIRNASVHTCTAVHVISYSANSALVPQNLPGHGRNTNCNRHLIYRILCSQDSSPIFPLTSFFRRIVHPKMLSLTPWLYFISLQLLNVLFAINFTWAIIKN